MRAHDPKKLSLADLPAELRNLIYTFALVAADPILLPYAYQHQFPREPPLLAASRWVRAEACPIFYGCNIWQAPSPPAAQQFLKHLSARKIARLRLFRPLDLALPPAAADDGHRRWFDALRASVNRLVTVYGQGALKPEAVQVPVLGKKGVHWERLQDLDDFDIVRRDSEWTVEWREGVKTGVARHEYDDEVSTELLHDE